MERIIRSIALGNLDKPTTSKITYDDIKEVFDAKEWNFFSSFREETWITSTSSIF
jgi:hypothetical protein